MSRTQTSELLQLVAAVITSAERRESTNKLIDAEYFPAFLDIPSFATSQTSCTEENL